jgi:hypothetical protein
MTSVGVEAADCRVAVVTRPVDRDNGDGVGAGGRPRWGRFCLCVGPDGWGSVQGDGVVGDAAAVVGGVPTTAGAQAPA